MFAHFYANYGGYFWAVIIAAITFAAMILVKKSFINITKKFCATEKSRKTWNIILGIAFSIGIALVIGKFLNFLFAFNIEAKWFVAAGMLANYVYLIIEKFREADLVAFAKEYKKALEESNLDVDVNDLPKMTEHMKKIVAAFAISEKNEHAVLVEQVAKQVAASVDIVSAEEEKDLEKQIEDVKSMGADVAGIEQALATARSDGKFTEDERAIILAALETIRKAVRG